MANKKKTDTEQKKKLTAIPPREPQPTPIGFVRRSWGEILMATNHLNATIRREDSGRMTLKEPSQRTMEKARSGALL